jgi:hypothetical protein
LQPHNSESSPLRVATALATVNVPGFLTPVEASFEYLSTPKSNSEADYFRSIIKPDFRNIISLSL